MRPKGPVTAERVSPSSPAGATLIAVPSAKAAAKSPVWRGSGSPSESGYRRVLHRPAAIGVLAHGDRRGADAIGEIRIKRAHRAGDEGQGLQRLHDAAIIGGMDNRVGAVADDIELCRRDTLAVELGEIGKHAAAETKRREGRAGTGIDLFERRAVRPCAAGRRRLTVDGRRHHHRIEAEAGIKDLTGDLGQFQRRIVPAGQSDFQRRFAGKCRSNLGKGSERPGIVACERIVVEEERLGGGQAAGGKSSETVSCRLRRDDESEPRQRAPRLAGPNGQQRGPGSLGTEPSARSSVMVSVIRCSSTSPAAIVKGQGRASGRTYVL